MFSRVLSALCVLGFGAGAALADPAHNPASNKQLVIDAISNTLLRGDPSAVETYFADPYIQHNHRLPSGIAALKAMAGKLPGDPDAVFEPIRILAEGDLVATHSVITSFGPPLVAFDVFRIDNGKIVEHWDNLQPLASAPNPSGRTQIDGATEVTDLDRTEANKAKVTELIEKMFIGGEKIDITQYISPTTYLQHNTMAGDGLEGLGKLMAEMKKQGRSMRYTKLGLVVAEGNFVLTGAEGQIGDQPTAFYDLFRLEDGLIVEHWDVIAAMPSGDLPPGYPGKF